MEHEKFEKKVMNALLSGEDETLAKLRKQYEFAEIILREFTGVGFFTTFSIDIEELRLPKEKFVFGDVSGGIYQENSLIGFVLFIEAGYLHMLEGYTFGINKWPSSYDKINIYFNSGKHRDIEALREEWR